MQKRSLLLTALVGAGEGLVDGGNVGDSVGCMDIRGDMCIEMNREGVYGESILKNVHMICAKRTKVTQHAHSHPQSISIHNDIKHFNLTFP